MISLSLHAICDDVRSSTIVDDDELMRAALRLEEHSSRRVAGSDERSVLEPVELCSVRSLRGEENLLEFERGVSSKTIRRRGVGGNDARLGAGRDLAAR